MGSMYIGQASPYIEAFNIARGSAANIFSIIERKSEIDPASTSGEKLKTVNGTLGIRIILRCDYSSVSS